MAEPAGQSKLATRPPQSGPIRDVRPTHREPQPCAAPLRSLRSTDHPGVSMTLRKLARELRDYPATICHLLDLGRGLRGHDLL